MKRDISVDAVRGLAIILMILAHSFVFFDKSNTRALVLFSDFTNLVAFISFLMISGVATYYSFLSREINPARRKKAISRTISLLFIYFALAIFVVLITLESSSSQKITTEVFNVLTFQTLPSYTEFLVVFIAYGFLIILFHNPLQKLINKYPLLITGMSLLFIIGAYGYLLDVPSVLIPFKSILFGHEDWYRFPMFQYACVYLLGIRLGKDLLDNPSNRKRIMKNYAGIISITLILVVFLSKIFQQELSVRWPPSLTFLLVGAAYTVGLLLAVELMYSRRFFVSQLTKIASVGMVSLSMFVIHIVLLRIYRFFIDQPINSIIITLGLSLIVLVVSYVISIRYTTYRKSRKND